jgi:hypothetical protein
METINIQESCFGICHKKLVAYVVKIANMRKMDVFPLVGLTVRILSLAAVAKLLSDRRISWAVKNNGIAAEIKPRLSKK